MDFFSEMIDFFGLTVPAWIFWALGALFIILVVVFILKGFFSEIRK